MKPSKLRGSDSMCISYVYINNYQNVEALCNGLMAYASSSLKQKVMS